MEKIPDLWIKVVHGIETYRCPEQGCSVRVRFRGVSAAEAKRLVELALGHSRHCSQR